MSQNNNLKPHEHSADQNIESNMTTQLNSLRLLIKCSFQRNLTRRCSSQVQLSDVKQCNKTVRVRVAVSSTGISIFPLQLHQIFSIFSENLSILQMARIIFSVAEKIQKTRYAQKIYVLRCITIYLPVLTKGNS